MPILHDFTNYYSYLFNKLKFNKFQQTFFPTNLNSNKLTHWPEYDSLSFLIDGNSVVLAVYYQIKMMKIVNFCAISSTQEKSYQIFMTGK